jgi:cytidine deaminase
MLTDEGVDSKFKVLLVVGSPHEIIMPCGICREAIHRYGAENATVLCSNQSFTKLEKFISRELYPHPYTET